VSEAQVQTEAAQGAQASGQPVDLHVPVHRLLAHAAGRLALGVKAIGQVGDRLLEALRDGREVPLVAGDQRRVGLGSEVAGKVECAGGQRRQLRSEVCEVTSNSALTDRFGVPTRPGRGQQLMHFATPISVASSGYRR
jgi:hypothetical protein